MGLGVVDKGGGVAEACMLRSKFGHTKGMVSSGALSRKGEPLQVVGASAASGAPKDGIVL